MLLFVQITYYSICKGKANIRIMRYKFVKQFAVWNHIYIFKIVKLKFKSICFFFQKVRRCHSYSFHTVVVFIFQPILIKSIKRIACRYKPSASCLYVGVCNILRKVVFDIRQNIPFDGQFICRRFCFFGGVKAVFIIGKLSFGKLVKLLWKRQIFIGDVFPHWGNNWQPAWDFGNNNRFTW